MTNAEAILEQIRLSSRALTMADAVNIGMRLGINRAETLQAIAELKEMKQIRTHNGVNQTIIRAR